MRVETALYDGYRVPVHYDPLIAKLIAHADSAGSRNRSQQSCSARIRDRWHRTNIPLHLRILEDADFKRGHFATDFLKRYENAPAAPEAIERAHRQGVVNGARGAWVGPHRVGRPSDR